jgi:hypothetical protein
VFALVVAAGPSAFAQSRNPFSPSTAGVRFDQPAVQSHGWKPRIDFSKVNQASPAASQSTQNRAQGIGFGVEAGFARVTIASEDDDENESGNAGMFGVWVGGNKGGRVGFTGEFLYVKRKITTDFDDEFKSTALEIPAVFHVNFGRGGPEDPLFYVLVGPVFSINLKEELNDLDISDDFNGADFGIMGGAGFEILRFAVEGRYNRGLRNIDNEGELGKIKNHQFEVVVKFRFSGA